MRAEEDIALAALAPAYHCLDIGDTELARKQAQQTLRRADAGGDRLLEAEALLCLSLCDRFASRFRRCLDASLRASQLFQALGVSEREAAALTTLSYAAGTLGRNEEAVEASLLAIRLLDGTAAEPAQVTALNYLGVAYFWGHSFDEADAALDSALKLAKACEISARAFQPLANLGFAQHFRISTDRERTGRLPNLDTLHACVGACAGMFDSSRVLAFTPGIRLIGHAMWSVLLSIDHSWRRETSAAAAKLCDAQTSIAACGSPAWLQALAQLANAEFLWAGNEADAAQHAAAHALRLAARSEHEPLARIAHGVAGYMFESRGRHDLSIKGIRQLQRREQHVRSQALASRARVIDWQLSMRSSERSVQRLQTLSRHLERVSLEDPLTHVANRRGIEQRLVELLGDAEFDSPLVPSVALIDVDDFKSVNDTFSHRVGDQVLMALARIFTAYLRDGDLVARLAGDEFVILFRPCDAAHAEHACNRVREAVAAHRWDEIAEGLHVSVSVGVTQTRIGDSAESALHRSDLAMYRAKSANQGPLLQ